MKVKTLHTVYVGKGEKAKAIPPGEIIDTKSAGIVAADVDALISAGFLVEVETKTPAPEPVPPATPADSADPAAGE